MRDPDLNLLRVFDTLIELRSVTRAAERLGLTQSAVSHALGRLRRELGDPLFLRGATGLRPTARAEEIATGVREGLRQLRSALDAPMFDPAQASRRFTIATGAYFCKLLVPVLVERMRREAPHVTLRIVPLAETLVSSFDRGTVDLALAGYLSLPARFVAERLCDEDMVWIAAADHPVAQGDPSPAAIAAATRVILSTGRPIDLSQGAATDALHMQHFLTAPPEAILSNSDDSYSVYDAQTALAIVACTDMVALVPRRIAAPAQQSGDIVILSLPAAPQSFSLSMFWHSKQRADPGLQWFRTIVAQSFELGDDR